MVLYNSKNRNFKFGILCLLLCFLPWVSAQPSSNVSPPSNTNLTSRMKPSMIVIMVVLVCTFFFLGFFSIYIRRCAERGLRPSAFNHSFSIGGISRRFARGLDSSLIDSFPVFLYSAVKNLKIGKSALECAVCLNEFQDDELLRLIPNCNHVFHPDCIETWLNSHTTCPVCRADLLSKAGEDQSGVNPLNLEPENINRDEISIDVIEETLLDTEVAAAAAADTAASLDRPPRSKSTGWKLAGLFPRSHSTGHSVSAIQPAENSERFTLILPPEARKELMRSATLNRSTSLVALPRAGSSRRGYRRSRSGGRYERIERAGGMGSTSIPPHLSRSGSARTSKSTVSDPIMGTPPKRNERADGLGSTLAPPALFARSGSARFSKPASSEQVVTSPSKRLVKSVTSPFDRMPVGGEETREGSSEQFRQESQI